MNAGPRDVAQIRLDNALGLFDEFVRNTVKDPDAATLRGLERRFAERLEIQPSYWSQIKSRARQIGERLARQFEQRCHKPYGWMDEPHGGSRMATSPAAGGVRSDAAAQPPSDNVYAHADEWRPQDDDERFIMGLVLTYYRRHPQRARTRLLDLLGEVLTPAPAPAAPKSAPGAGKPGSPPPTRPAGGGRTASPAADPAEALWRQISSGVAPLKRKR